MRKTVLVGFMGAGKTTAARSLAQDAVDVDAALETELGRPIAEVFATDGEAAFRAAEERLTLELLAGEGPRVLALGGGALTSPAIRQALDDGAHEVVWIDADPDTAWQRAAGFGRPLARDPDAFRRLYAEREPLYAEVAGVIVPAERARQLSLILAAVADRPAGSTVLWATSASGEYPVVIASGLLTEDSYWPGAVPGRRFLVTDGHAGRLYGERLEPLSARTAIMPGEQSKTIAHAEIVWTELVRAGMTRQDVLVALGGGVVGDLAGFCAATYQRGVRFVQVPTTVVAQVDSAYGGKTGVDLPEAKNYVGAYHQPSAVLVDPLSLQTLPAAELAAGYAEVIKTALIAGGALWARVRAGAGAESPDVIAGCALTKLRIVARDERDGGLRQVLNLGHTVGHAIETVTGYARFRHGEAVALGLLAALRLSGRDDLRAEVAELMVARGLADTMSDVDADAVVMATQRDKKRLGEGMVPFVLLDAPGRARPGCEVSHRELIAAVRELSA
ncbi:MAG TPA: bifunctional shikimate kinase/3-dehydroquinate synthase [Solirubrobacteraceae bacterium]|nr:bifunctional shikimate kinase/3-dehydroquinate synthase [Solirubrobacteraceae bacterium]